VFIRSSHGIIAAGGPLFDPTSLGPLLDFRPSGFGGSVGAVTWTSTGSNSGTAVDGSANSPTDNGTHLHFTRSNTEGLYLSIVKSRPKEIWIRFRLDTLTGSQYLIAFDGSHRVEVASSGNIFLSTVNSTVDINAGVWYVMRVVIPATGSTGGIVDVNNGQLQNLNAGCNVNTMSGTANIGIGINHNTTASSVNGDISHIFVFNSINNSGNVSKVWNWFATNADWD
jgi:hypothetical protein